MFKGIGYGNEGNVYTIDIDMNEFVLVEFIAEYPDNSDLLISKLADLGPDFVIIKEDDEHEEDEFGARNEWLRVTGMISSLYASVIKLRDPFLAERMRISYIPDALKDKYRT